MGTVTSPVENILTALDKAKCEPEWKKKEWVALCPSHDDRTPSLGLKDGANGCAVIHCLAGCKPENILEALGLSMRDLFPEKSHQRPHIPLPNHAGKANGHVNGAAKPPAAKPTVVATKEWELLDPHGGYVATHVRKDLSDGRKAVRWRIGQTWNLGDTALVDLPLYGCHLLAARPNVAVVVTEGEKAADAVTARGVLAVGTVTGASACPSDRSLDVLLGRDVLLWPDNDEHGYEHMRMILAALEGVAKSVRVVRWKDAPPKGDAADFKGTDDEFLDLIASATTRLETPQPVSDWDDPMPLDDRPLPDFPVDALPPVFRAWVEAEAEAVQVPAALPACLALGVASMALARADVRIKGGWEEPSNLYIGVAMDSGNRKSAVFRDAMAPTVAWEKEMNDRFALAVSQARAAQESCAEKVKVIKTDLARGKEGVTRHELDEAVKAADETTVPVIPRLFTDDVTSETLATMLSKHGCAMGVSSPEGGIFETMAGRYSDGVGNFDVYLKGHGGETIRVDRGSRPSVILDNPRISIILAFQHDVLRKLAEKDGFEGRGLLARFAFAIPKSIIGSRSLTPAGMPYDVSAAYDATIKRLINLTPFSLSPSEMPKIPTLTWLSDEARALFLSFRQAHEPRMAPTGDLHKILAWASKYPALVLRIASVLHAVEDSSKLTRPVSLKTMESALEIGRFFLEHARGAFLVMCQDPEIEKAKTLITWLRTPSNSMLVDGMRRFTKRGAHQGLRGSTAFRAAEDLDAPLRHLVNFGWIRPCELPEMTGPGRRPGPTYEIHPTLR